MKDYNFIDSNVIVKIFRGMCSEKNEHYHPSFLFFFEDQENDKFWMVINILSDAKNEEEIHQHFYDCSLEEIQDFIKNGELFIDTRKNKEHYHTIFFSQNNQQGFIFDLYNNVIIDDIEEDEYNNENIDE